MSDMITLNTGKKSSFNKTAYKPPSSMNRTNSRNPFRKNNTVTFSEDKKEVPDYKTSDFPSLGTNSNTITRPTRQKSMGYMSATKKTNTAPTVSRHDPRRNKINVSTIGNKSDVCEPKPKSFLKPKSYNDDMFDYDEREQDIVEEMRFSLSPDDFDEWYEHYLEENNKYKNGNNVDDYSDEDDYYY